MSTRLPAQPPVLAGYTYSRLLGSGGFADVYLFEQNMPKRSVAVKVLLQKIVDENVLRTFNAEADSMARLSAHPSILTVFDASISSDGRPFLVMELCKSSMGGRYRKEQLTVSEVLNIGVKIASALETAHRTGLLHRDIKPSNILITSFGTPVLADFGIAGSIANADNDDVILMSVPWSAPEVVELRSSGSIATEVWALGATLYTLLAGRSPFEADGAGANEQKQLSARISKAKFVPVARPDVPARLQQALARALSRDPAMRQASMLELATELQHVQHELGLMPTPLEVANDDWIAADAPVNFDNAAHRGPVVTTVAQNSRRPAAVNTDANRRRPDEDDVFSQAPGAPKKSPLVPLLWVAGSVVVLAIVAIVGALVLGAL